MFVRSVVRVDKVVEQNDDSNQKGKEYKLIDVYYARTCNLNLVRSIYMYWKTGRQNR